MADPFVGEIRIFGGTFAPFDWAFCDGRLLPIAQYDTLFSLIGTAYGGDGVNNFALPDLRGRLPIHQGNGYTLSQQGGAETAALQANQLPVHTHTVRAKSGAGDQNSPEGGVWAGALTPRYSTNPPSLAMKNTLVDPSGGSQTHDNMMPFLTLNFIISLNGIYPTRP